MIDDFFCHHNTYAVCIQWFNVCIKSTGKSDGVCVSIHVCKAITKHIFYTAECMGEAQPFPTNNSVCMPNDDSQNINIKWYELWGVHLQE